MFYLKFLFLNFILIYNYYYLFYVCCAFLLNYFVHNCIKNYYWLDTNDFNIYIFGNIVYLLHYLYLNSRIKNIYNYIYNYVFYLNYMIDILVKYYLFNNISQNNINNEIYNILNINLQIINLIEKLNIENNELQLLLKTSKIKMSKYLTNNVDKTTDLLKDIRMYNK